jgi:mediator of RNA polymerase II transcription subunit 5
MLLTALLASSFNPVNIALCMQQAFSRMDPSSFNSFSQTFDMVQDGDLLSIVRQEFLSACALQHLISEQDISGIIGDSSAHPLPSSGRTSKDDFVAQLSSDIQKAEAVAAAMEAMEGNAGPAVLAMVEVR